MHIILKSASLSISSTPDLTSLASPVSLQNIYLFYFLSKEDTGKLNRLSSALEHNIANPHITKIFVFTDDEKRQRVVPSVEYVSTSKFYFSQIQDFIEEHGLQGYMIIGTPYTTFGENLRQLKGTSLHAEAAVLNVNAAIATALLLPFDAHFLIKNQFSIGKVIFRYLKNPIFYGKTYF